MSTRFLAIFVLILACASAPARAQGVAAPFDGDLQRLAEILGGLHYLRGRELDQIMLYVEADNTAAVHTYTKLGFANYHVDAAYARTA